MSAQFPSMPVDRYIRYDELTTLLRAAAEARPDLVRLDSIGRSYEGREIWCATVTHFASGGDRDKPAVWCDANIHATEVSPTTALTWLLERLVGGYGSDPAVTRALETRAFYIVPRVNPDGAELFLSDTPRYLRSSTRPWPFDEEPTDGLRRCDIDGDGLQLQMRIPDPHGPWKCHPDEPRLMVRREPTEVGGAYYRLLPEGMLDRYDGWEIMVAPHKEGLDLNRNFPAHWRPEGEQYGAGPYPTSEPEARALVDFLVNHRNVCHALTFHTYSGVLLRPYGTQPDDAMPAEDLWTFEEIGRKGTETTGYPAISVFHDFKYHPKEVITGVFDDWCYDHLGMFAWTVEIWSPHREAGIVEGFSKGTAQGAFRFTKWGRHHDGGDDLKLLHWADRELEGKGYHEWRPFEHPQLGPVEIGGWDALAAFRNPPPRFLEREIKPFAEWVIWQALSTPLLEMESTIVETIAPGRVRVRARARNTGWLPTYLTRKALERKVVRGVIAEIALPEGAALVSGKPRVELRQLEGFHLKGPANSGYAADTTEDRLQVEWIVDAPAGARIDIVLRHDRAGLRRSTVVVPAE
ncbi:MAG: M14 family metallopeptidase [Armatimonadota bacterium]